MALAQEDLESRERRARLKEELRHQRELMDQGFRLMERRFEQADKRFEALTLRLDRMLLWTFGTTVTVGARVVAAPRVLG